MSFETGTAADMHDLLDRLRVFLVADSWTINKYASDSQMYKTWTGLDATGSHRLHVQKTLGSGTDTMTCFFNFRSATRLVLFGDHYSSSSQINNRYYSEVRGIGINGSTSYSGAGNWDAEPGAPVAGATAGNIGACITELPASSFLYWFFSDGDAVHVVAEVNTNVYVFMSFGRLANKGGYTGGMYYSASSNSYDPSYVYWTRGGTYNSYIGRRTSFLSKDNHSGVGYGAGTTAVYITADSVADWRHSAKEGSASTDYSGFLFPAGVLPYDFSSFLLENKYSFAARLIESSPNEANALSPMLPVPFIMKLASGRFCYLGNPAGVRLLNRTLYVPGQTMLLGGTGGEEWLVFPVHQVGPDPDYPGTGDYYLDNRAGYAFRKS